MKITPILVSAGLLVAACSGESAATSAPASPNETTPGVQRLCTLVNPEGKVLNLDDLDLQSFGRIAILDELTGETSEGQIDVARPDGMTTNLLAVDYDLSNRTNRGNIVLSFTLPNGNSGRLGQPCHVGNSDTTQYFTTIAN